MPRAAEGLARTEMELRAARLAGDERAHALGLFRHDEVERHYPLPGRLPAP